MTSNRHNRTAARTADDTVLDAARDCVLAVGVRRTTLTDIARRAGVSRMTLYRRWPDVRTIVADLMTREWTGIGESLQPPDDGRPSGPAWWTAWSPASGRSATTPAPQDHRGGPELLSPTSWTAAAPASGRSWTGSRRRSPPGSRTARSAPTTRRQARAAARRPVVRAVRADHDRRRRSRPRLRRLRHRTPPRPRKHARPLTSARPLPLPDRVPSPEDGAHMEEL